MLKISGEIEGSYSTLLWTSATTMYQGEKAYQSLLEDEHDDGISSSDTSTCGGRERIGTQVYLTRSLWSRAWVFATINIILFCTSVILFAWSASRFAPSMEIKNKKWRDVNEYCEEFSGTFVLAPGTNYWKLL
jgi:hypothetical protein